MSKYEYKVVPAPAKAERIKGVKGSGPRFALTVEALMNELGALGWEYLRADTLPAEERLGLTSKTTVFQNMLIFRRQLVEEKPVESNTSAKAAQIDATTEAEFRPGETTSTPVPANTAQQPSNPDTALTPSPRKRQERPRLNAALVARAAQVRARQTAAE